MGVGGCGIIRNNGRQQQTEMPIPSNHRLRAGYQRPKRFGGCSKQRSRARFVVGKCAEPVVEILPTTPRKCAFVHAFTLGSGNGHRADIVAIGVPMSAPGSACAIGLGARFTAA